VAPFVREVRGIPLWLMRDYLVDAGGRAEDEHTVVGEGWTVKLTQLDDYAVGSLRVGQLRVELDGEPEALERMQAVLEQKLLRAGG
jgi:hypothetical protein